MQSNQCEGRPFDGAVHGNYLRLYSHLDIEDSHKRHSVFSLHAVFARRFVLTTWWKTAAPIVARVEGGGSPWFSSTIIFLWCASVFNSLVLQICVGLYRNHIELPATIQIHGEIVDENRRGPQTSNAPNNEISSTYPSI